MSENNPKESDTSAVPLDYLIITDVAELRKAAKCIFFVTEEDIAYDLSDKLNRAANTIEALQKLVGEASQIFPVDSFDGEKMEWIKRAELLKE